MELVTAESASLSIFPMAQNILREFGNLHVGSCGDGVDFATSDVDFNLQTMVDLESEMKDFKEARGISLIPLAAVHYGHGFLVVDETGRTYLLSDELEEFAPTFDDALEMLLLGKHGTKSTPKPPSGR